MSPREKRRPPQTDARTRRQNLILVGYRGSGKTTVGRLAASALGWIFLDTDELVTHAAGRSIAAIFAQDGEPAFRQLESQAIGQAVAGTRRVISVGGGAVLLPANRQQLTAAGVCVWLTAPPEELHRRLAADPRSASQRPALTDAAGLEEVRRVLAIRQPLYQAVAQRVVDTFGRPVEEVVREVLAAMSHSSTSAGGP